MNLYTEEREYSGSDWNWVPEKDENTRNRGEKLKRQRVRKLKGSSPFGGGGEEKGLIGKGESRSRK